MEIKRERLIVILKHCIMLFREKPDTTDGNQSGLCYYFIEHTTISIEDLLPILEIVPGVEANHNRWMFGNGSPQKRLWAYLRQHASKIRLDAFHERSEWCKQAVAILEEQKGQYI